jgi:hypothetical protein
MDHPSEAAGTGCVAAVAVALALSGCASTQLRSVATAGAPAYELRGQTLFALDQQAQGLCPRGYTVVRQWERQRRAEGDANVAERWWLAATGWLQPAEADQAQMTVQCKL